MCAIETVQGKCSIYLKIKFEIKDMVQVVKHMLYWCKDSGSTQHDPQYTIRNLPLDNEKNNPSVSNVSESYHQDNGNALG